MIKAWKKTGTEKSYHNTIQATHEKPIASITMNGGKQEDISFNQ